MSDLPSRDEAQELMDLHDEYAAWPHGGLERIVADYVSGRLVVRDTLWAETHFSIDQPVADGWVGTVAPIIVEGPPGDYVVIPAELLMVSDE